MFSIRKKPVDIRVQQEWTRSVGAQILQLSFEELPHFHSSVNELDADDSQQLQRGTNDAGFTSPANLLGTTLLRISQTMESAEGTAC